MLLLIFKNSVPLSVCRETALITVLIILHTLMPVGNCQKARLWPDPRPELLELLLELNIPAVTDLDADDLPLTPGAKEAAGNQHSPRDAPGRRLLTDHAYRKQDSLPLLGKQARFPSCHVFTNFPLHIPVLYYTQKRRR